MRHHIIRYDIIFEYVVTLEDTWNLAKQDPLHQHKDATAIRFSLIGELKYQQRGYSYSLNVITIS